MAKIITVKEAAELVQDGAVIGSAVQGMTGWPEEIGLAIENRFMETGHPSGITHIHGAGHPEAMWTADHDSFLEAMADAAKSIVAYRKNHIAFLNVMCNMSVDCDCCAVAEDPKMADIGILSSLDPVALDQACLDLVYSSEDPGKKDLIKRIESRNGVHTVEAAAEIGVGSREYELICID